MKDLKDLVRPNVWNMKPYSSARDEFQGNASVFLDANENPFNRPYNRYPDPLQWELKKKIAEIKGVKRESIFLGNGSDEPIDLIIRAFCEPSIDSVVSIDPSYGMYEVAANVNNVEFKKIKLDGKFDLDTDSLLEAANDWVKVIFLCSPNNPTGNNLSRDRLYKVLNTFQGIVVIDEAYSDFSIEPSFLSELDKFPNLIVLQTMSKAWGAAGIRLGMAFASPEIIAILNKIKYPYNVNLLTQERALYVLENKERMENQLRSILSERIRLQTVLPELNCVRKIYPTDANFILVEVTNADTIYKNLVRQGIIVRNRTNVTMCNGCLRITVGKPGENDVLLDALKKNVKIYDSYMKRALFIDRDGTLVIEPPVDYQLDSLEKLEFYPKVFRNLYFIRKQLDFEFVMVTNQDGLGTDSFPEDTFWPAHNKMLKTLEGEGIRFDDILIDRSFPEENSPNRKPRTGMLGCYLSGEYDLANSYVIGDRLTDMQLAVNLGAKGIWLRSDDSEAQQLLMENPAISPVLITDDWDRITEYLFAGERRATVRRTTKETEIFVEVNLDGHGRTEISTGLGFFDHMLDQIGKHSGMDLTVRVKGDLEVDEHHTIEDTAIALGEALSKALGDKRGIERYGYCLPMDDCLCSVALDFGGRPWLVWDAEFRREKVGDMPTEMFLHFFKSLSDAARMNLNIRAEGVNEHHKIEGIFKALARSIKMAIRRDIYRFELPSTKGAL